MKKLTLLLCLALPPGVVAQKFISEKSTIFFFSKATIENIAARNEKAMAVFDTSTGEVAFSVPVKDFVFEKKLMQEHFNEKYLESEKFPKATFQGKLAGFDPSEAGTQNVRAQGRLAIHGVTKDVDIPGTLEKQGDRFVMNAKFIVTLTDYDVKRPQVLWQNIAEAVDVTIDFTLKPHEK